MLVTKFLPASTQVYSKTESKLHKIENTFCTQKLEFIIKGTNEVISNMRPWAVRLSWLESAYSRPLFSAGAFDPQSMSDWPSFGVRSVGLCTQDYKSLCAAVMICVNLVNMQTLWQHFNRLIWKAQPAKLKKSMIHFKIWTYKKYSTVLTLSKY